MRPARVPSRRFIIIDADTVAEARDRQEEKRPNKRARVDDSDNEDAPRITRVARVNPDEGPYKRDPVYFNEDETANCVVRIKGWVFKIQAGMLSCCPSMAELLEEHIRRHGLPTEEKPFFCPEPLPTVDEYRAFLWALYATGPELKELPHNHEELERLSLILKINQKYDIPKMKKWAVECLHKTANDPAFMESCSSASLTLLVDIAKGNEKKYLAVLDATLKKWCDRVWNKSTPSVPALQVADRYELHDLLGVSYYVHVQDMLDRQTGITEKGATQLRADPKLNNGQVMRLLTGYWSLVNLWEHLRLKPVAIPMGNSCSKENHAKCTASWERRWISAVGWKRIMGHNSADILALLTCLRDQLSNDDDLKAALDPECRLAGFEALKALRTKIQDGLADHFFACV